MIEIAGAIARWNLLVEQAHLLQGLGLEGIGLLCCRNLVGRQHVPSHVKAGCSEVFTQCIGGLEVDALQHALLQLGRHGLAGVAMAGVVVEDLGNGGKRLIELRRHLHEVAGH